MYGETMWDSFEPIMEHIGIRYSWQHEENGPVRLTFERINQSVQPPIPPFICASLISGSSVLPM